MKSGTRKKKGKQATPVRREIQNRGVPLPPKWDNFNFIAIAENKADLARFLSRQLILQAADNKKMCQVVSVMNCKSNLLSLMSTLMSWMQLQHE